MSEQFLTIDADNPEHFYFAVEGPVLALGADSTDIHGIMIRNVRIKRIHCELEVSDEPLFALMVGQETAPRKIELNQEVMLAGARLHIRPALEPAAPVASGVARRLVVVDGADLGRTFTVQPAGVTRIGKNSKMAHVALNDLYAAQVHCELSADGEHVYATHVDGSSGTFINRQRISGRTEIRLGDILRAGNTHLRLELGVAERRDHGSGEKSALRENTDKGSGEKSVLRTSQVEKIGSAVPAPPPEPTPLEKVAQLANQSLGHFQMGEILGKGQVGVVFRAVDLNTHQTVALKVLSPEFPKTEADIQTFSRAFKSFPVGRDPHVTVMFGVGKIGAYTWIAREFVDGSSLEDNHARALAEGKLNWRRACRLIEQLAGGLDFLHRNKIVHGNLTPRNILIGREDKHAKITDVLLGQALEGSQLHKSTHQKKRQAELSYRAPEQLTAGGQIDARTDLFALGIISYMMVTGSPPFTGISAEEIADKIAEGKIAKPSRRQKDLPGPIEAAILRLLANDPKDRFQSVAELLEVVEPIVMMYDSKG